MPHHTRAIARRRNSYRQSSLSHGDPFKKPRSPERKTQIAAELGPCVYFIRSGDCIKIGHTGNIAKRRRELHAEWDDVLAVYPGTYDDEQKLLAQFVEHLDHGYEWFRPAQPILDHINTVRAGFGLPPAEL